MIVYEAMYCPNTWESGPVTLSIHLSKEGAQKVIDDHKEEKRKQWQELVDADEDKGTELGYDIMCPFGQNTDWWIKDTEVLP